MIFCILTAISSPFGGWLSTSRSRRAEFDNQRFRRPGVSAAAQRLDDDDFIGRLERLRQVARLLAVDEDSDMATYAVLLVDDAEPNPGVGAVQIGEDGGERGAARFGLATLG